MENISVYQRSRSRYIQWDLPIYFTHISKMCRPAKEDGEYSGGDSRRRGSPPCESQRPTPVTRVRAPLEASTETER